MTHTLSLSLPILFHLPRTGRQATRAEVKSVSLRGFAFSSDWAPLAIRRANLYCSFV